MNEAVPPAPAMVVTDLDGTLLDSAGRLSARNRSTLDALGRAGIVRVVATGRNLHSALRAMPADMPIDYLVFASGAGTLDWPARRLLHVHHMDDASALDAARRLMARGLDFMLHVGVPDNHRFWYHRTGHGNPDFERRLSRYSDFAAPWPSCEPAGPFSQLLAVASPGATVSHDDLLEALAPLSVVRTTSPIDHESWWFEVFAPGVSKAAGAARLGAHHAVTHVDVLAVGNDFNDESMLEWAHHPRVVANAPQPLRARFPQVASNDDDGFAQAVADWLSEIG